MKLKEKQKLEKAINECVAAGFSELETDIHGARDMFYVLGGGVGGTTAIIIFFHTSFMLWHNFKGKQNYFNLCSCLSKSLI